jgi:hypothetical protein
MKITKYKLLRGKLKPNSGIEATWSWIEHNHPHTMQIDNEEYQMGFFWDTSFTRFLNTFPGCHIYVKSITFDGITINKDNIRNVIESEINNVHFDMDETQVGIYAFII